MDVVLLMKVKPAAFGLDSKTPDRIGIDITSNAQVLRLAVLEVIAGDGASDP